MSRLEENRSFLHLLLNSHHSQVIALLKTIDKKQSFLICEIVLNTLEGVLKLSPHSRRTLQKYKVVLRKLAEKKGSIKSKQKLINSNCKAVLHLLKVVNKQLKLKL